MPEINRLEGTDRKRLNEEAQMVKSGNIPDPLAELPRKFMAIAKVVNDGRDVSIYLPTEFIGRSLTLEITHLNSMYLTSGVGIAITKGHHIDDDQNIYGAMLRLPQEIMEVSLKRTGQARHICTRLARKIIIGDMLNKLTAGYTTRVTPTSMTGLSPPVMPRAPKLPMPVVVEQPVEITQSERETLRMAQGIINDAIKNKGYTAQIQPDNTIKLTMEI